VLRPAALALCVVALAGPAGCGGGGDGADTATLPRSSLPASGGEELEHDADRSAEGVEGASVCRLLPAGDVERIVRVRPLRAARNDSLDLSICAYRHGDAGVRVLLDGAADATRRYYNQFSEAAQKLNTIPSLRPHNVRGVGDDRTYGGTGAYWTRGRAQLVAFEADRIARVTVSVPGQSDARRRREAARIAKLVFARMPAERAGP
jgi:hypothetical protein